MIFLFLFAFYPVVSAQNDSSKVLSLNAFMSSVKQFHPVAKQAELLIRNADANMISALGNFDPKLFYGFNNKFFDGKNYYGLTEGGFTLATRIGLEVEAGFEQNSGVKLNPENVLPENGLLYSKFSLQLLQGVIIDERRAALKQARIFKDLSATEKIAILNELMYRAGKAYWDWQLAYENLKVHREAVGTAKERFEGVKKSWALGDRPAIDTVEASIQWQDRELNFQQGKMDFISKGLMLSNFLWTEGEVPVVLNSNIVPEIQPAQPERIDFTTRIKRLDSLVSNHPELRLYDFKMDQLLVDKRLKQDKLKPKLKLDYNPLYRPENLSTGLLNNYKWGVSFGIPVFLRKERGDLAMAKIKINQLALQTGNKRNELMNKTRTSINEYNNLNGQIEIYSKNVNSYIRLWESEKRLFDNGESSLFMINSREMSMINARLKLNEIINKNRKAALDADYAFGVLNTMY